MLGWALNKATGNASTDAPVPGPDDTFVEQPDTPAPVFAAQAFRRALFGTPAPPKEIAPKKEGKADATSPEKPKAANADSRKYESPTKPQGILLTPGTGTSRRKRVSFGRDVKSNAAPGDNDGTKMRPRTKLQEVLEKSRKQKSKQSDEDDAKTLEFDPEEEEADDAWEEVDDVDRDPDITVDLNEPRSQSGRYWKTEFQKYHDEARTEMEKLVKYKQLAKSYAKAKDAEALDLNERLKEEQAKVVQMEDKITKLAGQMVTKQGQSKGDQDDRKLMEGLTRQTALAVQYRNQVEELETLLKESGYEAEGSKRKRGGTSPRTTQTLLETQRELRKAREQIRELDDLRQELQRVKSELAKSMIKMDDVERKLSKAEHDRQRKDSQYERLKADYNALKEKNKAQKEEIATLKRERRASKSGDAQLLRDDLKTLSTGHEAPTPWAKKLEDLQTKLRHEQDARRREMEDASVTINQLRQEFKRTSEFKSPDQRRPKQQAWGKTKDKLSNIDEDTIDLHHRALAEKKQPESALGGLISRGSKRKASGSTQAKNHSLGKNDNVPATTPVKRITAVEEAVEMDLLGRQRTRASSRELRTSTSTRARSGNVAEVPATVSKEPKSPALCLAKERSQARKLDPAPDNSIARATNATSRSALSADRRAAAFARLEQKRAERRRAQESTVLAGKENLKL